MHATAGMPRMDGLTVLRELKKQDRKTKVVVLPVSVSSEDVIETVRLDVRRVVLKDIAPRMLVNGIRNFHEGGQRLERASTGRSWEELVKREEGERELANLLTARQIDLVRFAGQGLRKEEVANRLPINKKGRPRSTCIAPTISLVSKVALR